MKHSVRTYDAGDLAVSFDARRCIHAEVCVHGLPAVFDRDRRPWIDPSHSSDEEIAEVVSRCPTGALKILRPDGSPGESPAPAVSVRVEANGPLYVRGDVELVDRDGNTVLRDLRVALCRCGLSRNKPLCDNTHAGRFSDPGAIGQGAGEREEAQPSSAVRVRANRNGPLVIDGVVELVGHDDAQRTRKAKAALCRCGASQRKPFCDGTHKRVGFAAD